MARTGDYQVNAPVPRDAQGWPTSFVLDSRSAEVWADAIEREKTKAVSGSPSRPKRVVPRSPFAKVAS